MTHADFTAKFSDGFMARAEFGDSALPQAQIPSWSRIVKNWTTAIVKQEALGTGTETGAMQNFV